MNNIKKFVDFVNESTINEEECGFTYDENGYKDGSSEMKKEDKKLAPVFKYLGVNSMKDLCLKYDSLGNARDIEKIEDSMPPKDRDHHRDFPGNGWVDLYPDVKADVTYSYSTAYGGKYKGQKVVVFTSQPDIFVYVALK
jgi:hypothetical protein